MRLISSHITLFTGILFSLLLPGDSLSQQKLAHSKSFLFASHREVPRHITLTHKNNKIRTVVAVSTYEKTRGLSGIRSEDFAEDQGLLFYHQKPGKRLFWMPDTYFDLDIFFLDQTLKVIKVARSVPSHPGYETPPEIPRVPPIHSQHVLEMKASSPISKSIQEGDHLRWSVKPR